MRLDLELICMLIVGSAALAQTGNANAGETVTHADVSPPAYSGASCARDKPEWDSTQASVAEVTGDAKLALHPDYPGNCVAGSSACDGKAFLIRGNRVTVGPVCGDWTDVQYEGSKSTSWGWVESRRLRTLGRADGVFVKQAETPPLPAPPVCAIAKRNLDMGLKTSDKDLMPFPLLDLKFHAVDQDKYGSLLKEANDDSSYASHAIADLRINGVPVKIVAYSEEGSCPSPGTEIWSSNFGEQLYPLDSLQVLTTIEGVPPPETLASFEGQTYLVWKSGVGPTVVRLYGFEHGASPELACELTRVPRHPEIVVRATDQALCDSVATGNVETVPTEDGDATDVDAEAFGADVASNLDFHGNPYTLSARATVDLYNDGHPLRVGIASGSGSFPGGCAIDGQISWPVILDNKGLPDLSAASIDVSGDETSLIRYHGVIYVDTRSVEPARRPEHRIFKLTRNGKTQMCSLIDQQYEVQH